MTRNIPLAMLFTVLASVVLALAATLQHSAVRGQSEAPTGHGRTLSGGQLLALFGSGRWWLGNGLNVLGSALTVAGLLMAPVMVVQPLAVLAMPWTVMMGSRIHGHRITASMWTAIAIAITGVVAFGMLAYLSVADEEMLDDPRLVAGGLVAFTVAGAFALAATRGRPRWRTLAWSSAAAVLFGMGAGLVKGLGEYVATRAWLVSPTFWILVVLLVVGSMVALLLLQQGYANGAAGIVVGVLNSVGPVADVTFGIVVLGEGAAITAPAAAMMLSSAAVAIYGVALLSRFLPPAEPSVIARADPLTPS